MQSTWIRGAGVLAAVTAIGACASIDPDEGLGRGGSPAFRPSGLAGSGGSGATGMTGPTGPATTDATTVGVGGSSGPTGPGVGGAGAGAGGAGAGGTGAGGSTSTGPVKNGDGTPCISGSECISTFCVDGVCCNSLCNGTCMSCSGLANVSNIDGMCSPIKSGFSDPACLPMPPCGPTGTCNGAGSCNFEPASTTCAPAMCMGTFVVAASHCSGTGLCNPGVPFSCGLYNCVGQACPGVCSIDSDCASTAYCAAPSCVLKLGQGQTCTSPSQCQTNQCIDGVCCNSACPGTCKACSAAKKGQGMNGICDFVAANLDPDSDCAPQPAPCGAPGLCNGGGACIPPPSSSTVCTPGSCVGNTATDPSLCDGGGTCLAGAMHNCPNGCQGTICKMTCVTDAECAPAGYCLNGNCTSKLVTGTACSKVAECSSGFCVDGVCCDGACNGGSCDTCTVAGGAPANGTCTLLNGPAPAGACDDQNGCTADVCQGGLCGNVTTQCTASTCNTVGACDPSTGKCPAEMPLDCSVAGDKCLGSTCDTMSGLCSPPVAVVCAPPSDACHAVGACDMATGKCPSETAIVCPTDGLSPCETSYCDVAAKGCVTRSKLDGAPCTFEGGIGVCVAGSCFISASTSGGAPTSSVGGGMGGAGPSGVTVGLGGVGGGSLGPFHFAGGACSAGGRGEGRFAWLLAGMLLAAGARRRSARTAGRGTRDA